jgi:D-alanyl-D-alanine-carboxypeptidase/D-alanyl-D-alanine-endopeptidase
MKRLHTTLSAIALALALSGAAHAQVVQGLDGRWEGPVTLGNGMTITVVFRATTSKGVTTTVFDSPDQGAVDIPATVKREGDMVTFEIPSAMAVYTAKLSADGKTLAGDLNQGGGAVPLTMTQKPASTVAAMTTPAVAGIDGRWEGSIDTPAGSLGVTFRASTAGGKTTTLIDVPMQNIANVPTLAKRDGQKVTFEVPGVGGKFTGDLSADNKTLAGFWDQMGQSMPLTLAKK